LKEAGGADSSEASGSAASAATYKRLEAAVAVASHDAYLRKASDGAWLQKQVSDAFGVDVGVVRGWSG
jgi:ABC-type thiamine transport system substrate-binding protein